MTFRQVSHCWEASGDCCFSSRGWWKISLHVLNAVSWLSLLRTELRWKAVMQMCHITVALFSIPLYDMADPQQLFLNAVSITAVVTWKVYYFICFIPSEISLDLSLKPLSSSEERVYLHRLLSNNSVFSTGVWYGAGIISQPHEAFFHKKICADESVGPRERNTNLFIALSGL